MVRSRRLVGFAAAVALIAAGSFAALSWADGESGHAAPRSITVRMVDMQFTPATVRVPVGATVTWVNDDSVAHTVTSGRDQTFDGLFQSGDLEPGHTFRYTFDRSGTYPYFCAYHPGMTGEVIVGGGGPAARGASSVAGLPSPAELARGEPVGPDGLRILPYTLDHGVKVFHLTVEPVAWTVRPGHTVEAWSFNGTVPGPVIRVDQGDTVRIVVTNKLTEGTSVHWHGLDVPFAEDGVAGLTQPPIRPGESFTYTFKVDDTPGSYIYHAHPMTDMLRQEEMGLFGPFIVEPAGTPDNGPPPGYRDEFTLVLNDSPQFGYTINGRSYPATPLLPVHLGDRVLVHLINMGDMNHPMHLHGFHFQWLEQDGSPLPTPWTLDTIDTAPGTTYDLAFVANKPGVWLFHCHILPHVTDGTAMAGMITAFVVK
jgi:FtsP/CotA-like multicopper oxidase with cupredoxin domain